MATVFILTMFILGDEPLGESKRITALPIRIGRNDANDLVINHSAVSSFHARIDDIDGRLCVTDLGSTNGTRLASGAGVASPMPAHQPCDLQPAGFQFFLSVRVRVQITFEQVVDAPGRRGAVGVPFQPAAALPAPAPAPVPSAPPAAPDGRAATGFLQGLTTETMALQGLRELASSLIPNASLETTGDIARFITKLHDSLDAFCRSFIPLHEGHSQFMSSLDLQRAVRRAEPRSDAYLAVETARTPEALAAALLDPKQRAFDAPLAIESIMADLMLHQLALLDGVMRGVQALLEELSPDNVESQIAGRMTLGRHRALWNKYRELFETVSGERQAFAVIFGPEFATAYRQYRAGNRS